MMLLGGLLAAVLAQAQPDRTMSGLVVNEQGKPVAGARVVLYAPPLPFGQENTAEAGTTTDAEGRYRLTVPPLGRTLVNGVNVLVYQPGLAVAAAPFFRRPDQYKLRKAEPRTIKVEGPDGRPIAGARVAPRILYVSGSTVADVPGSLADPMAVTTGADGSATLRYLTVIDQLGAARVTADSIGTQDFLLIERPARGSSEPVIVIRLPKTTRLAGRIVGEAGGPVAGQVVEVWSRGGGNWLRPNPVALTGGPLRTAANGSFRTPDNLMVGSAYRIAVRSPGKEPIISDWMTVGETPRTLLPMRLGSLRTVGGRVVDRQGKPVADALVFQSGDGPERTATRSGPDGRFSLGGFRRGPVFLFVRGDGFRFNGQLIRDGEGDVSVELTRIGEPPGRVMRMLPELIPIEESRAMARRLIEPLWKVVVKQGDDPAKLRTLEALAGADPAGTLEKIESARFVVKWREGRIQAEVAAAMAAGDPEEAAAVAEAIADPGFRAEALIDVVDALSASRRPLKLALLDRAALHARATADLDNRLRWMGHAAERMYELGEVAKARALFAEGLAMTKGIAEKTDFRRGAFAAQLALVDRPAALAIVKDFAGDRQQGRILTNLAFRLIEKDPAEAERIWKQSARMGRVGQETDQALAWKMAAVDPGRALGIVESWPQAVMQPDMFIALALGARQRDEAASRRALDEGIRRLDRLLQDQPERLQSFFGSLLPVVERIDPGAVPEVFWRDVAARPPFDNPRTISAYSPSSLIQRLACYDREVAAALFEPTRERIEHTEDAELATRRLDFLAWSLFDPRAAVERLERVPVRPDPDAEANAARIEVARSLGLPYEQRWRSVFDRYEIILGGPARGF